jgi:hypothetical protein
VGQPRCRHERKRLVLVAEQSLGRLPTQQATLQILAPIIQAIPLRTDVQLTNLGPVPPAGTGS